jgi:hypothetical protein
LNFNVKPKLNNDEKILIRTFPVAGCTFNIGPGQALHKHVQPESGGTA